jgi:hypothetical protein
MGDIVRAAAVYAEALAIWRDLDLPHMTFGPQAGLARLAMARGDLPAALVAIEPIIPALASPDTLSEAYFPLALACYEVLKAAGDPRAVGLLRAAVAALEARAALIEDTQLRQSFFERIPTHRALRAASGPSQVETF